MAMFIVDWETFKVLRTGQTIYWIDDNKGWDFYVMGTHNEVIRCTVAKSQKAETNIIFVEENINAVPNTWKVMGVDLGGSKMIIQPKLDLPQLQMMKEESARVMNILPDTFTVDSNVIKESMNKVELDEVDNLALSKRMLDGVDKLGQL